MMKEFDLRGFDMSYIEDTAPEKQQYYWVGLYYFLAKAAIDACGETGERVIRKSVRAFGRARGRRMRQISNARGLPANLTTLFDNYDLMSDPRFVHPQEGRVVTAQVKKSITGRCPDAEMWRRMPDGLHIGSLYCEEVHHQIYGGFDPAVQVNLCETLTNGGDQCRFHIYCRPSNQCEYPLPPYIPQSWEDFEGDMVASIHSIFCLLYLHMAGPILQELGQAVLVDGLEQFCQYRGIRTRALNLRDGLPLNAENFLLHGDLFLDHRFGLSVEKTAGGTVARTSRNILREVCESYGYPELEALYSAVSYPALLKGYNQDLHCELAKPTESTPIKLLISTNVI